MPLSDGVDVREDDVDVEGDMAWVNVALLDDVCGRVSVGVVCSVVDAVLGVDAVLVGGNEVEGVGVMGRDSDWDPVYDCGRVSVVGIELVRVVVVVNVSVIASDEVGERVSVRWDGVVDWDIPIVVVG